MGMTYSCDLARYRPMCPSCHRLFDNLHALDQRISESGLARMQRTMIERLQARVRQLEEEVAAMRQQKSERA